MKKGLVIVFAALAIAGCKQESDMGGTSDQYQSDRSYSSSSSNKIETIERNAPSAQPASQSSDVNSATNSPPAPSPSQP